MKLPRDINGIKLARLLAKYDYQIIRQTGSHIRLATPNPNEHHITIPAHNPLKVGTLSAVLKDISNHLNISKEQLIQSLFY